MPQLPADHLLPPDPSECNWLEDGNPLGCTGTPNDSCSEEKLQDITLPSLLGISAQGFIDRIEVTWDTNISYPDQIVRFLYRRLDGFSDYYDSPKTVARDDGFVATTSPLDQYELYDMWLRVEDAEKRGYWTHILGVTDPAWNSDSEIVYYGGDAVYHVDDLVLYDTT
jgi:hypothetical protein